MDILLASPTLSPSRLAPLSSDSKKYRRSIDYDKCNHSMSIPDSTSLLNKSVRISQYWKSFIHSFLSFLLSLIIVNQLKASLLFF